ncbi:MAG: NUDIX domain-containing protein [Chloroflexi bacterium]|nr:NUDIX domain-containing protein [Chloroflexota bacterium]
MKTYYKYALCIIRDNRLLVLEESDQELYLLPGGRPEAGESPEQALSRELKEELCIELDASSLKYIGPFEDVAAGKEEARVHIELYLGVFTGEMRPCSEVQRLVWFARNDDWSKLAPVTRNKILPALLERGLLA